MTQDEIIDMARHAGVDATGNEYWPFFIEELEAFAKLVAAKEREALRERFQIVTAAETHAAILNEREACAKLAEEYGTWGGSNFKKWFDKLATEIRNRK
jgi:hypothetical protein